MKLSLLVLDPMFAICSLKRDSPLPEWATSSDFYSITRTYDELSIVCLESAVPEGVQCERGWRCFRVAGTMDLSAVGVLASLAGPLAEAGISIFAISTFDTDYLLVKAEAVEKAMVALRESKKESCQTRLQGYNRLARFTGFHQHLKAAKRRLACRRSCLAWIPTRTLRM